MQAPTARPPAPPGSGAAALAAWLRSRALLAGRIVAPEEALLTGRFAGYAARRLTAFLLARGSATALHVIELTWLTDIFAAKAFVASLALQNATLVLDAAYWGALEAMRRRARELGPSSEAAAMVTRWLTVAIWAGAAIALVPIGRAAWGYFTHEDTPSMLHIYALACMFRLGADVVVRTYYSGVYAYGRVHRPLWSVFLGPLLLVGGTLALWRPLAGWSFPLALVGSVIVSRALLYGFTKRAYRRTRVPAPSFRLRLRLRKPDVPMIRATLLAALANTSTRLGAVVLLAAVIPSLQTTLGDDEVPIVEPFALALHLAAPLLLLASQWGLVFYHDYKRLEDEVSAALATTLHRRILAASVLIGLLAWACASGLVLAYVPAAESTPTLLALLPSIVGVSVWTALQLRGFTRGHFARQLLSATSMLLVILVAVLATPARDPDAEPAASLSTTWYLALAAGPWAGVALQLFLNRHGEGHVRGVTATFGTWAHALAATRSEVVVWRAVVTRRAPLVATLVAAQLGERGAVVRSRNRVFWFDSHDVDRRRWLRVGAGCFVELEATRRASGKRLLAELSAAGALVRGVDRGLSSMREVHRRLFPEGFVVEVASPPPARFSGLPARERQAIWRDALRDTRDGRGRGRSGWFVTGWAPEGVVEAVFVAPRPVSPDCAAAWRGELRKNGWWVPTARE